MQLAPTAATPPAPTATAAAAPQPRSTVALLPKEMQLARIGKGTVRSEVDRSLRVLLRGDGPPSKRELVPDSKAAAELLASPHGPAFAKTVQAFLAVADDRAGGENLRSVTLLPDEHSAKGVAVLNWATNASANGSNASDLIEPDPAHVEEVVARYPGVSREYVRSELRKLSAKEGVKLLTKDEASEVAFSAAWNTGGNVVVMPDTSRELLSSVGLYRMQPGDDITRYPTKVRDRVAKQAWHTMVHEIEHSVSPITKFPAPEWTRVMEEAIPEVLTPQKRLAAARAAGADLSLTARPVRDTKSEAVDWKAWNREHLPKPKASSVETAQGRYTDGPELLRSLLRMAGIDRRTTDGKARAESLLQDRDARFVPRRIATAIGEQRGLGKAQVDKLAELIRDASVSEATIGDIERLVAGATGS
jgi:hypothetical protein